MHEDAWELTCKKTVGSSRGIVIYEVRDLNGRTASVTRWCSPSDGIDETPFTTKTIERGVSRTTDDASDNASKLVSCSGSSGGDISPAGDADEPNVDWDVPVTAGPPPPNKVEGWLIGGVCAAGCGCPKRPVPRPAPNKVPLLAAGGCVEPNVPAAPNACVLDGACCCCCRCWANCCDKDCC